MITKHTAATGTVCGPARTSIIAASQNHRLVAPLVFQGNCNTEVVDVCFEQALLPALRSAASRKRLKVRAKIFVVTTSFVVPIRVLMGGRSSRGLEKRVDVYCLQPITDAKAQ